MSFDTPTFWLFFALVLLLWRTLPFTAAKTVALLASLVFYGWWDVRYVGLLAFSALVDFHVGRRLAACELPALRRRWLTISLATNLGLLAVFKYAPFATDNAASLARLLGFDVSWSLPGWVIPVGISFYTFQTLSYSIDIYRRQLRPADSFLDFFLFVSFFPQLVAGPIVRASELLPQLSRPRRPSALRWRHGLEHVVVGLFLKIVVADHLAPAVERVFDPAALPRLSPAAVWIGVVEFSVQIFADFAGYSSIAIGLASLMGLSFPKNFEAPYISRGLSEFWTRWHISLSSWLRDYLYIPLGGNRHGAGRTTAALLLTMLLGGLWHGPAWTFVAWGALHGLGLVVERALRRGRRVARRAGPPADGAELLTRLAQVGLTYVFVLATWVFFRAGSLELALDMLRVMFVTPLLTGELGLEVLADARHLVLVALVAGMHLGQLVHEWGGWQPSPWTRATLTGLCLVLLTVFQRQATQEFLYFQF